MRLPGKIRNRSKVLSRRQRTRMRVSKREVKSEQDVEDVHVTLRHELAIGVK